MARRLTYRSTLLRFVVILAGAGAASLSAATISIPVNNPSFETLPAGGVPNCGVDGCFSSGAAIPGWTNSGASGAWQPAAGEFVSMPDGPTVGYTNNNPITQTVGALVTAGYTYTMTVEVGNRADFAIFDAQPGLIIGGTFIPATGAAPAAGQWSLWTATFTGTAATAGDSITIALRNTGSPAGQADFDGVTMSVVTPEPASYLLIGGGLLSLGAFRRRFFQSRSADR